MSGSYRVPKRPVCVELRTILGGAEPVTVFLGERAETHSGPETPLDLFGAAGVFLPVSLASGEIRFLARDQIVCVALPPEPEAEPEPFYGRVVKVSLVLTNSERLEGGFAYACPEALSRLQDFLNQSGRFVELHSADGVVLVNKRHIAHVSEL
jgi:hypothetical protein